MTLPELDGVMWLKEGRKTWRKHYFALRASGIYFNPKGRTKVNILMLVDKQSDRLAPLVQLSFILPVLTTMTDKS